MISSRIIGIKRETHDTVTLRLEAPITFTSGQFIMIGKALDESGKEVKRSYSISSASNGVYLEITVKEQANGVFSTYAQSADVGEPIQLYGPFGHHFLFDPACSDVSTPVVFLAGGSGIAPFRSMLQSAVATEYKGRIFVFYSVRNSQEIIFSDELQELAKQLNCTLVITLTQPTEEDTKQWTGPFGRIGAKLLESYLQENILSAQFYICGPTPMVQDCQTLLASKGVLKERIKTEKFGAQVN